ncbi:GlsB/YeaQ/YmgE family stress response membrane protein [Pantoea sp. BAV 3049]|uniref:GlsB/YeaQ/YmgE family stress response membrane protein n=1 Tax=Pantoea sp. BAV 3049 TaxID=2654188 RepID=UPI00131ECDC6|nr:GlsB/YeaQ/YmgE family stress response membrane protein [Pantoea sp. BAV 3049]
MGILSWIVFGFIAGILAKWIMPGKGEEGFIMTVVVGIAGALIGGFISTRMGLGSITGFDFRSFGIAVVGALIVIFIHRKIKS